MGVDRGRKRGGKEGSERERERGRELRRLEGEMEEGGGKESGINARF